MGSRYGNQCDMVVSKIRDHSIDRGKYLPGYSVNMGIKPLESDANIGKPFDDNLCFLNLCR